MGKMTHRNVQAIVKYHQWSLKKQAEQYFHVQLLLYFPWRREIEDLLTESYQESYMTKKTLFRQTEKHLNISQMKSLMYLTLSKNLVFQKNLGMS